MTEFTILGVTNRIDMENDDNNESSNNNNKAFQIQLKDEFSWFLSDEFKELRANFGREYYNEYISSKQQQQKIDEEDGKEI